MRGLSILLDATIGQQAPKHGGPTLVRLWCLPRTMVRTTYCTCSPVWLMKWLDIQTLLPLLLLLRLRLRLLKQVLT